MEIFSELDESTPLYYVLSGGVDITFLDSAPPAFTGSDCGLYGAVSY